MLVYVYEPGSKGGLKLIGARHMDMDLKLQAYNDISDKSRRDLKEAYDKDFNAEPVKGQPAGALPVKKVEVNK